jgi:HAD superfamily hydrolase (TIGR01509 family)
MFKGTIFDMDGVIVDSHPAHERAWRKFLLSMGKSVSERDLEFIREGRKKQEILQRFLGDLTDDEVSRCCNEKDVLFQKEAKNIRTIPGLRRLLGELKQAGIPAAVASCGSLVRVHRLLNVLQLKNCFVTVLTGDDVTLGKPDPEIFLKVAEQMCLQPSEILVFEDSVSGVLAATAAGMKCIGIGSSQRAGALLLAGAAHVIPDFVGASLIRLRRWFSLQPQSYETSANSAGVLQQTVPDLETC